MIKEQESFDKLTEITNFALANQRRAPALKADTPYLLRARMLRTLHLEK